MASLATNIVLAADPAVNRDLLDAAIAMIADRIGPHDPGGPSFAGAPCGELWERLRAASITDGRPDESDPSTHPPPIRFPDLRLALRHDERPRQLVQPARPCTRKRSHRPLERDAVVTRPDPELTRRSEPSSAWIRENRGQVRVFRRNSGSRQLMGVGRIPIAPQGLARETLVEIAPCVPKGKTVPFCKDFNRPAISLSNRWASNGSG